MGTHQLHFIARMDHTLVLCLVFLAVTCLAATADPTVAAKGAKQCYNCGFRQQLPNGEKEKLPDTAECNDFATPEDITVNCGTEDDCCAMLKEFFTTIDEDTGENSTVMVGRHGCESDLNHIGEQTVLCSDHPDAFLNSVGSTSLLGGGGIVEGGGGGLPIGQSTEPTGGWPTGVSSYIVPSFSVLILALLC